ncbi:MAG: site-2 protease family protein [Phycisphaerae bacterium]|nr:site-2 protease family protein [Phycisphaerae bacterium]MCZ2400949.1 site-2 protease family protein [Phycisphaerae bacterium]
MLLSADLPLSATLAPLLADGQVPDWLYNVYLFVLVVIGFSIIIFVHELGHFLAAKWVGIRVDRFAVGFGYRLFGYRRGEGFTFGDRPDYNAEELREKGYGETDYCFKALPVGGYVRMLGQDDIVVDDKSGDIKISEDPRAFPNRPVGQRMIVVSAGVIFNLLFAALLLGGIFMHGTEMDAPLITVLPGDPAYGKLQTGDRIVRINGAPVESFRDILVEPILSSGVVSIDLVRDGEEIRNIVVDAPKAPDSGLRTIGVAPFLNIKVATDARPVLAPVDLAPPEAVAPGAVQDGLVALPAPRKGDLIRDVNGVKVTNFAEVREEFRASGGGLLRMTVERADPGAPPDAPRRTVTVYQTAELLVVPDLIPDGVIDPLAYVKASHLLGMHRRPKIRDLPDGPAKSAGLQPGDVIVEWDTVPNPTYAELLANIRANAGKPVRVLVQRGSERVGPLHVTPKRPFQLFGQAIPKIHAEFCPFESDLPVVADIEPNTPAAEMNLPRGARLLAIDGTPVRDWHDVVRLLKAAAGRQARVSYQSGEARAEGVLRVPGSVVSALDLPVTASIVSIDGEDKVRVRGREESFGNNPVLIGAALRQHVGRTVKIEYRAAAAAPVQTAEYLVRADETDPWPMRIVYQPAGLNPEIHKIYVSAHGNPLTALRMGGREVLFWVVRTYQIIKQMVSRDVGVQHMSGPVGIFGAAVQHARASWTDLLYFMAYISINLAVLNFLPIPVMDGGLMVFLLIEKIKGKPLSIKTQMITTLVGLAAILLVAILVTVQDIGRLF